MKKIAFLLTLTLVTVLFSGCSALQARIDTIGADKAKTTALEAAGISAAEATFVTAELDENDGKLYYDIDFIADGQEYEYDIDAYTGTIIAYRHPANMNSSANGENKPASDSVEKEVKPEDSSTAQDVAQDAPAATAQSATQEQDLTVEPNADNSSNGITEAQAKEIALSQIPGAVESDIRGFEVDYDDGRLEYEGTIYFEEMEYEFEIDGYSGAIRNWDVESIYD